MSPTTTLSLIIIFLTSSNIYIAQTTPPCQSIYVNIEDFGTSLLDVNNWEGVYSIDDTKKSFNASIWRRSLTDNKWLKYIETHWVLSGANNELLIYESTILFPPVNKTTTWIHEVYTDSVQIRLDCSSTLSPTASPTPAPTTDPTHSPTISECDVLIVSDSSNNNDINHTYFTDWKYYRLPTNDYNNRPIWQYEYNHIESYVQFLSSDGWIVFLNDGHAITTYSTGHLFANYPPLNQVILFNKTTNNGLIRIFTFICLNTDTPTNAPTISPTNIPSLSPVINPSMSPTQNPNEAGVTYFPSQIPTVAPSIDCEVLKISIPHDLKINNNPHCNIDLGEVFNSYWLKQISRSNRPSWTLDCDDANEQYTQACRDGYSGSVFFISSQWEIEVHSKKDDCFERFIVENTGSFFIPRDINWIDASTMNIYSFTITCLDKIFASTPQATGETFVSKNTVYIYDEVWFWIAFILILLICCVLCFGAYYWNKQRKPVVVYQARAVKSVSRFSRQELELQDTPNQAYVDDDVAPGQPNNNNDDDLKSNTVYDGIPNSGVTTIASIAGSTIRNPNINPNLKRNVTVSVATSATSVSNRNIVGELKANISISDNDIEDMYDNPDVAKPGDKALEMIAGNRRVTGYSESQKNNDDDDDVVVTNDLDEIFSV